MEFLIITGLSGAGKTRAADVLEDLNFYCVDNMPVALMPRFAELCVATRGRYEKVALVTDVRDKDGFEELIYVLDGLKEMDFDSKILYMDADTRTLVRRYKESRRPHPLYVKGEGIEEAIEKEKELLKPIRKRADYIINTSSQTLGMLQNRLFKLFAGEESKREIEVNVISFGFKHGIPIEADNVFDVRFLPNPYYVEDLRPLCGLDAPIREFVFGYEQSTVFTDQMINMLQYLLPMYIEEGKTSLNIGIGCTGGRHRSVAIAAAVAAKLQACGITANLINRDIDK